MSPDINKRHLFGKNEQISNNYNVLDLKNKWFSLLANDEPNNSSIDTGFTYLGQMIAHDKVSSAHNHKLRTIDTKMVSPILNLDSIYDQKQFVNNKIFNKKGEFIFNNIECGDDLIIDADLARKENGPCQYEIGSQP